MIKDAFVQDNEKLSLKDAFRLLQQSLRGLQKDNIGPVTPSRLKQAMQRKLPTFDEGVSLPVFLVFYVQQQTQKPVFP